MLVDDANWTGSHIRLRLISIDTTWCMSWNSTASGSFSFICCRRSEGHHGLRVHLALEKLSLSWVECTRSEGFIFFCSPTDAKKNKCTWIKLSQLLSVCRRYVLYLCTTYLLFINWPVTMCCACRRRCSNWGDFGRLMGALDVWFDFTKSYISFTPVGGLLMMGILLE